MTKETKQAVDAESLLNEIKELKHQAQSYKNRENEFKQELLEWKKQFEAMADRCNAMEDKNRELVEELAQVSRPIKTKSFGNVDAESASVNTPDIRTYGYVSWVTMSKAWSDEEGWMKSTKAIKLDKSCLVQVSTQQRNLDGTYSLAESLQFMPGYTISDGKEPRFERL